MKQKSERIADATRGRRAAPAATRTTRSGAASLGQAVDGVIAVPGLDALLLPMTAYDRLRFGGPTSRETWVDGPRAEFLTPVHPVWPLRTERLVLRPFELGDADAFVDAWTSEEWTSLLLTRTLNRAEVEAMVRRRTEPGRRDVRRDVRGRPTTARSSATRCCSCRAPASARARSAGRSCRSTGAGATPPRRRTPCWRWVSSTTGCAGSSPTSTRATTARPPCASGSGMRREVHKRGDFWSKGRWTDSYEYALLRDEWRAARGR